MVAPDAMSVATNMVSSLLLSIVVLLTHGLVADALFLRSDPRLKVGARVQIISNAEEYYTLCEQGDLMPMIDAGSKGVIYEVDFSGKGSVAIKTAEGDKAWVPIRALKDFKQWTKGGKQPPPSNPPAGGKQPPPSKPPAPAAPAKIAKSPAGALVGAPAVAPAGAPANAPGGSGSGGPAPAHFSLMPTDFFYHGCQRSSAIKDAHTVHDGMNKFKCFLHCSKQKDAKYFAITSGGLCFCSVLEPGATISSENCDMACAGDPGEICGGINKASSVYTMLNSSPPPDNLLIASKNALLSTLYGTFEGQSCGEASGNLCEINSASKLAGTSEECKLACWQGHGAERCDGFTFNKATTKCTFLQDVTDGEVVKKKELICFFKKLGFPG